jgi:two-component system response regulator FixJ
VTDAARVLLVDDEEVFVESTSRMLEKHGYEVETALDAVRARELLASRRYDCVVSDVRMPGNARFEFIEGLAGRDDAPPVVVITAHPSVETAVRSLDLRISSYLVKPIEIDELLARIEQAIREERARRAAEEVLSREVEATELAAPEAPASVESLGRRASLSPREAEVLRHLIEGYRVNTIARKLAISQHTVRNHLKKIFAKLDVRSQTELLEKLKP